MKTWRHVLLAAALIICTRGLSHAADEVDGPPVQVSPESGWKLGAVTNGSPFYLDRAYHITSLPKEMEGGHIILRPLGPRGSRKHRPPRLWLEKDTVRVTRPCTIYLAVGAIFSGKELVSPRKLKNMERNGWKRVAGVFETTASAGQQLHWVVLKNTQQFTGAFRLRDVSSISGQAALLFVFK